MFKLKFKAEAKKIVSLDEYLSSSDKKNLKVQPEDNTLVRIVRKAIRKLGNSADLNFIDTSKITDMNSLFDEEVTRLGDFNGDISSWDVSKVVKMGGMFCNSKFNGDISSWDVSNVKNMYSMFSNSEFNNNISNWNVSNVKDMRYMFSDSQFNKDLSSWKINPICDTEKMFLTSPLKSKYGENAEKLK